jgi:hypothetical protein
MSLADEKIVARMAPELREIAREILPTLRVPDLSDNEKVAYIASVAAVVQEEARKHAEDFLPPAPVSPQDEVRMEQLAAWLEPWARAVRSEVFGAAEPPFSSLKKAAEWIEREYEDAREAEELVARDLGRQVDAAVKAWLAVPVAATHEFARITIGPEEARVHYFGKDGWARVRGAMGSVKLSRLAWAAEDMARAAGWNRPAQATTYLLLGVAAPMPHFSVRTWTHTTGPRHGQADSLRRREALLTIRGSDFSYDELREIWARLRKQGITEKKPLSRKHAEVWRFVEARRARGLPWKRVLSEWNAAHDKDERYRTIRGLQAAHRRAEEKGRMAGEFFEFVEDADSDAVSSEGS